MIPCIVVPVINRPELLDALIASIDHPVRRMVVVDNGDVLDPFLGGRRLLPFPVRVVQPGWNLGVAASWNLGVKCDPLADWWLVANSDLEFGPGDLARMDEAVNPRAAVLYKMRDFSAFALTAPLIHEVGWMDESFVLGYDDDLDYERRVELAGLPRVDTGFTGRHVGSASIYADTGLRYANSLSHPKNDAYYRQKWGGEKLGGETFSTPFNKGGHVGDWTLDVNRLRDQIWPRSKED